MKFNHLMSENSPNILEVEEAPAKINLFSDLK